MLVAGGRAGMTGAEGFAGRRVAVYGPTGCGKTSLGAEVARRLGIPHLDLDHVHWRPGWQENPRDQFREDVAAWLDARPNGWVCTGNYTSIVGDLVMARADTILWLRLPFPIVFWRLFWRTLRRSFTWELMWGTNRETFRKGFMSRDSILLWCITHWRAHARSVSLRMEEHGGHAEALALQSPRQVRAWLARVPRLDPLRRAAIH